MATIRKVKSTSKKGGQKVRYQAVIRRKGVNLYKTFNTKTEAEAWARIKEADVETGNVHALNVNAQGEALIKDLLGQYEKEKAKKKKSYLASEQYTIKRLKQAFQLYNYNELSSQHIVDYGVERLKTIEGASLTRELRPLSDMLEYAWQIWKLPERPNPVQHGVKIMRTMGLIGKANERERRLSDTEMDALYKDLSTRNPRALAAILFGVETGMRRGEICKLRWKNFDDKRGVLVLPREITKSDKTRTVPLTLRATLIMAALEKPKKPKGSGQNSLIFGYPDPNAVGRAFRRAVLRCGIEDLHFHDLRHEAISRWIEGGLSIAEVRVLSGHASLASLSRYASPSIPGVQAKLLKAEQVRNKQDD